MPDVDTIIIIIIIMAEGDMEDTEAIQAVTVVMGAIQVVLGVAIQADLGEVIQADLEAHKVMVRKNSANCYSQVD